MPHASFLKRYDARTRLCYDSVFFETGRLSPEIKSLVCSQLEALNARSPLLVTDKFMVESGALQPVQDALLAADIGFATFDGG